MSPEARAREERQEIAIRAAQREQEEARQAAIQQAAMKPAERIAETRRQADRYEALAGLLAAPTPGTESATATLMDKLGLAGSPDPATLTAEAARLRREAKRQEKTMPPDIAIETARKIRNVTQQQAAEITAALEKLTEDNGLDREWKTRERKRLLDALDHVTARAAGGMETWRAKAAGDARKALARDTRTPEQVNVDMGIELRAARLAKTVSGPTAAANILLGQAEAAEAAGDLVNARAFAMAAQEHGVPAATRMVDRLEAAYVATWDGHAEAAEARDAVNAEVESWRVEQAAIHARASRAAIAAARAVGDPTDGQVNRFVVESIRAKTVAAGMATPEAPYSDPIGPDPDARYR